MKMKASVSAQIYSALFPILAATALFLLELDHRTLEKGGSGILILIPLVAFAAELACFVVFNCRVPAKWGAGFGLVFSVALFAFTLMASLWPATLSMVPTNILALVKSCQEPLLFIFTGCFFFELFVLCMKTPMEEEEEEEPVDEKSLFDENEFKDIHLSEEQLTGRKPETAKPVQKTETEDIQGDTLCRGVFLTEQNHYE